MEISWELHQQNRMARAAGDAAEAKERSMDARLRLRQLEIKNGKALLLCEALWTLLREKTEMTDADLMQRVRELDESDGNLDGKVRHTPVKCPHCERWITRRFAECMYCGEPVEQNPVASQVEVVVPEGDPWIRCGAALIALGAQEGPGKS